MTTDWDTYWRTELADERHRHRSRVRFGRSPLLLLTQIIKNAWHRVLVVGRGISTEPALLARLGYEVTAIDVSAVAVEHVHQCPATEHELERWMMYEVRDPYSAAAMRKALARMSRPGGSLSTTCRNVRDYRPERRFDVVYSPWSWQCLDEADRAEMPGVLCRWTAMGGATYFATQNLSNDRIALLASLCEATGALGRGATAEKLRERWLEPNWDEYNRAWERDDIELAAKLKAGARMFDIYNASG